MAGSLTSGDGKRKPYVREARENEYDRVLDISAAAFERDPATTYFGSVSNKQITEKGLEPEKFKQLRQFASMLMKGTLSLGGRVVVVVEPQLEAGGNEELVAAAFWQPPNQRIELSKIGLLVKSGVFPVLFGWGLTGAKRLVLDYMDTAHSAAIQGFKHRGIKTDVDDSWYLMMVMVDPKHQGKGHLSKIMQEAYETYPNATFTLEATTPKSKAQYAHLGFEVVAPFKLGVGTVCEQGLPAGKEVATGFEMYAMVKLGPESLSA